MNLLKNFGYFYLMQPYKWTYMYKKQILFPAIVTPKITICPNPAGV